MDKLHLSYKAGILSTDLIIYLIIAKLTAKKLKGY